MVGFILLIIGVVIAGIPLGIVSIVHSSKVQGGAKAVLLPLSIIGLILTLVCFFGSVSTENPNAFAFLYFGGLVLSIVTLSVAVHYQRKANNKVFDDKRKEHIQSVKQANNKIEYIDEIKELKDLLDSGAITQEEYDSKKSEILNRK